MSLAAAPPSAPIPAPTLAPHPAPPLPPSESSDVAPPEQSKQWSVVRGSTLRQTLENWGRAASIEIVYQLANDMAVEVDGRFEGTFEEALAWLLRGFDRARPRPIARKRSNAVLIQASKDDLGGGIRS